MTPASFFQGKVKAVKDVAKGLLTLEVPSLAEANELTALPLPIDGVLGLPPVGSQIVVLRQAGVLRWLPMGLEINAAWLTTTRRALYSPDGTVLVGLDDDGDGVYLGSYSASKGVGRQGDEVKSTAAEDATAWNWLTGFVNVFQTWVVVPNDGGAALQAAMNAYIAGAPVPSSLTGKITGCSAHVKAVD